MEYPEIKAFDPTSWCEGVIGDGCGGGRIFFTCKDALKVYDPTTKEVMTLLDNLESPEELSKKGCHLFFTCKGEKMGFDLSKMEIL